MGKKVEVKETKFPQGVSGNPLGRPKGSKNKITILKLMAEEAVRTDNAAKASEVCNLIFDQALNGDKSSQKLVWEAVMSKGLPDAQAAKEKVSINITTMKSDEEKPVEGITIDQIEETDDETD